MLHPRSLTASGNPWKNGWLEDYGFLFHWDFQGPPKIGTPWAPYYSQIPLPFSNPERYGNSMGPAYHKGVPLLGVPGITLDLGKGTPPKFNSSSLKNGGWKTTFLLGFGNFSGAMLSFGRVPPKNK